MHVQDTANTGTIAFGHNIYPGLLYSSASSGEYRIDNRSSSAAGYISFFPNGQNTTLGTEAMRISTNGNVGIGTTTPGTGGSLQSGAKVLDVVGAAGQNAFLRVLGGAGATKGGLIIGNNDGSGTNYGQFTFDNAANTFTLNQLYTAGYLGLGANSRSTDLVILASNGNIGIGTTSPSTKFQVAGEISPSVDNTYTLGDGSLRFTAVYAVNGAVQTSDARLKKNIQDSDLGLEFINKLRPVSYQWNSGSDSEFHYGLIAQEAEKAIHSSRSPASATTPIIDHDAKSDRYGLRYSEFISPLIKAVQEIYSELKQSVTRISLLETKDESKDRKIASLEVKLDRLKSENELLKERMQEIEKALKIKKD